MPTIASEFVLLTGAPIGNQPRLIAGAAITAGMPVRIGTDGKAYPAVATGGAATADTARLYGLAIANAELNQPFTAAVQGIVQISDINAMQIGELIVVNNGSLVTYDDLVPGNYVSIVGVAVSVTQIELHVYTTGLPIPTPPA